MKAYNYTLPPFIRDYFTAAGYDADKIQQAVESNGNDNLRVVDTASRANHRFTPERTGVRIGKPASSAATVTNTVRFEGKGNLPEQLAAWADLTARMAKTFGELTAIPVPVTLKTWLDAKFRVDGKGKAARRNGGVEKVSAPVVPA